MSMDVDLPAEVRRHIMGVLHTGRRPEEMSQMRQNSSPEGSPSREMSRDNDGSEDVDMVLG